MKLGGDLDTDLEIFSSLHHSCPKIGIIRDAVEWYIEDQLARNPILRKRFLEAKYRRENPATVTQLDDYRAKQE